MHKIVQTEYAAPSKHRALKNERLVIHQRSDQSEATHVAIFVHGLGGSRYGDNSTWGDFPKLIFEDFPTVDIGMYYYRSLFRRLAFWRSIRLDEEAIVLADAIKSLNYHSIILLGHSMGGLLCKGTVAHLAATNQRDPIGKITGMFFLASPQLGSKKAPSLLAWLTKAVFPSELTKIRAIASSSKPACRPGMILSMSHFSTRGVRRARALAEVMQRKLLRCRWRSGRIFCKSQRSSGGTQDEIRRWRIG